MAICLLGPGIGFGFRSPAGRTDGGWRACGGASGPAARRAAAAAIIERGIHAFLPRCTPTLTPTYVRALYKFGFFAPLPLSLHPLASPAVAPSSYYSVVRLTALPQKMQLWCNSPLPARSSWQFKEERGAEVEMGSAARAEKDGRRADGD